MLPYAAMSRCAAPVLAPMSVIGPMRMLVCRQFPKPTKVRAVGAQLSSQDSRTTARRLGGVLPELQPLASVPAATRQTKTNDLPRMRKVCAFGKGGTRPPFPRRRCYGVTVVANTSVRLDVLPEFARTTNGLNVVPLTSRPS